MRKICYLLFLSLLSLSAMAAAPSSQQTPWQITANAYLWALNMNGHVKTGTQTTNINESFGEIMSQFQSGGMLWLAAQKNRFQIFFNGMYSNLKDKSPVADVTVTTKTDFAIISGGLAYDIYRHPFNQTQQLTLTPYAGARYTLNDVTMSVPGARFTDNQHWITPILGSRLTMQWTQHWGTELAGDLGYASASNKAYNLTGFVTYNHLFNQNFLKLYVGYRLLHQHYQHSSGSNEFRWNMNLFGPVAGISMTF